jgi:transposase
LAPFFGFLWSVARIFIRTPAGRNRLNILGALNAVTKELIYVANDKVVNAETVRELLDKIAVHGPLPITVILDNARYQHCRYVTDYAAELGIELLFLPAYSPNLNLIERLWKLIKKKCLYSVYYTDFKAFKAAILGCIEEMFAKHKDELDSLLTLNFQTFEKFRLSA